MRLFVRRVTRRKLLFARKMRNNPTRAEARLWVKLRKRRLGGWRFRRQVVMQGFIVDFYCVEAKLVVEVDGSIHLYQRGYDAWRQAILERERGVRFVRVTNREVFAFRERCLQKIHAALGERRRRPDWYIVEEVGGGGV